MKVTNVKLKKIANKNRLKAVATVTFDECFVVHELRVIDGKNGMFVAMPSKKHPSGEYRDIAHPITQEMRSIVEQSVIEVYNNTPDEI